MLPLGREAALFLGLLRSPAGASSLATGPSLLSSESHCLWERACSRKRRHIQHHCKLTLRFREQARSHRDLGCP
ncbi:hypothetical protein FHK92_01430 [Pseudomonas brassicacearum subsp. neoaurantiaca]|uniref:Uncharacterized protein n=1 Tax=Pseudomonas brassicacearum subsp. neoaurantiaca TaxID=494916 RepID=A0A7V8RHB7_9PSED|nr:hypothetical protein [Pseudomonas brassicacearum subsp. neoaurantiaca]